MDGLLDFGLTDVMLKLKEMKNGDTSQKRRDDTSKNMQWCRMNLSNLEVKKHSSCLKRLFKSINTILIWSSQFVLYVSKVLHYCAKNDTAVFCLSLICTFYATTYHGSFRSKTQLLTVSAKKIFNWTNRNHQSQVTFVTYWRHDGTQNTTKTQFGSQDTHR